MVSVVMIVAHLSLAVLSWLQGEGRIRRSLAGLALSFSVWGFVDFAADFFWHDVLEVLDETAVSFAAAFGINTLVAFVGSSRFFIRWGRLAYGYFGVLALVTGSGVFFEQLRPFAASRWWSLALICGLALFLSMPTVAVVRYALSAAPQDERGRMRTVLLAILVGAVVAPVDAFRTLSPALSVALPAMSEFGSLISTGLLYLTVARTRIRGIEIATRFEFQTAVLLLLIGLVLVLGIVSFQREFLVPMMVAISGTTILVVVVSQWVQLQTEKRERTRGLAMLGRMSAQLAHDLRNPITAVKNAAEFIDGEIEAGRGMLATTTRSYLTLIQQQVNRATQLIERYQLLGENGLRREPVETSLFLEQSLGHVKTLVPNSIRLDFDIEKNLPEMRVDTDLLSVALDNVLRNAIEAMPNGGTLSVIARVRHDHQLRVEISDTGVGMSPLQIEQAFQEFYTTKSTGSGLGLVFVRRIVENHGGRTRIHSKLDRGTRVTLELPLTGVRHEGRSRQR